jgi:hypothetical protein
MTDILLTRFVAIERPALGWGDSAPSYFMQMAPLRQSAMRASMSMETEHDSC